MNVLSNVKWWFKRQKLAIKVGITHGLYYYHRAATNMPQLVVEELRKHPADPSIWSIESEAVRAWKHKTAMMIQQERIKMAEAGLDYDKIMKGTTNDTTNK
jgi:hypothetical protein